MAAAIITTIALVAIFYADGYRFNFNNLETEKTGVLFLDFVPTDLEIFINNTKKTKSDIASSFAENLSPGFYNISLKKDGYADWNLSLRVMTSSVNVYKNIVLFKIKPEVATLTDLKKISLLNSPTDVLAINASEPLTYNDHEIWIGDTLVTRLAEPISSAVWYPDLAHVVYQQGDEIRVVEKSGQNDLLLVTLSQNTRTSFIVGNRGTELYYLDGDIYKIATIR